jgi:hypothetical protein
MMLGRRVACTPPGPLGGPGPFAPSVPSVVDATRTQARQELGLVPGMLPSGATPQQANPASGQLDGPTYCPPTPDLADYYDFWTASGDLQAVFDWITSHPPAGFSVGGYGQELHYSQIESEFVELSSTSGTLLVVGVPLPGGGTALRADSQLIWKNPRPAGEELPPEREQRDDCRPASRRDHIQPTTVSDPVQVSQIVAATDSLPSLQPYYIDPCSTPANVESKVVRVTFTDAKGNVLAEADANDGGCFPNPVTFSVGGQPQPMLDDAYGYTHSLASITGMDLS